MIRRLAVLTALTIALTACSGNKGSDGVDPSTWAEKVCKSIEDQAAILGQAPDVNPNDPAKAKESLLTYLGNLSTGLNKLIGGVRDAGTPKANDGTQVVDKVTTTLSEAKKSVDEAKSNLEKATVTDAASFQAARDKVSQDLQKLSELDDPTKDLKSNAELNDAFNKAPSCQKLDQGGPSTPPTT